MHNTGCSVQDAVHRVHLTGCTTSDVFHMDVLHRMHCIGYNDNDNVVIGYHNKKLNVYNENILLNMLILKVKLKANINWHLRIAKNIDKQLHCIASHPLLKLHNDSMACCDYIPCIK